MSTAPAATASVSAPGKLLRACAAGLALAAATAGCYGIPKGTYTAFAANGQAIGATGAGIVQATPNQTVFKVKCRRCRFESGELTCVTPLPNAPYTHRFVCPRCGYEQLVVIAAAK